MSKAITLRSEKVSHLAGMPTEKRRTAEPARA